MPTDRPSFAVLIRRAMLLRCAWCGSRHGFLRGWFRRHPNCQHCGMSVQRGADGFELGAATVNVMATLGALIVAGGITIAISWPDIAVTPLLVILGVVAVVLPIAMYPFSYTLWFAVEIAMDPPSKSALAEAAQRVAGVERNNA